jgi:hypothetical protein
MDVEELLKEPSYLEQQLLETQEIFEALVTREPNIFEEESITVHHMTYHKNTKKN